MTCTGPCGRADLTSDDFYLRTNGRPRNECKACTRERNRLIKAADPEGERRRLRSWRARNPERTKAQSARWRAGNPDKVRVSNQRRHKLRADMTPIDAKWIVILQGDSCAYCGAPMKHLDHIVPVKISRDSSWENLTAACAECNWTKSDKPLLHFLLDR